MTSWTPSPSAGEDLNFNNLLDPGEDRDPPNGTLNQNWSTSGGCGSQTTGAWHTGGIGSPFNFNCLVVGSNPGQCQTYETVSGTNASLQWWELLRTQVVEKVNKQVDATTCTPLARAEILNFAWNQQIDIADEHATFTWELDNDCLDPGVDLTADAVVLGSVTGPYGAMSVGTAPAGMGYPLFAPLASCSGSGDPCVTDADCPTSCDWGLVDINGDDPDGNNRNGINACFFREFIGIPLSAQSQASLAGPPDDDVNDNANGTIDETVALNGPLRNMDITRAGGPDLVLETLEDRIGDTGTCFQGAFGFQVRPKLAALDPDPQNGFGVTIDDVVLEWKETTYVPNATVCSTPGEAEFLLMSKDFVTGDVTFSYTPACSATDHAIYWGPCANPSAYSGEDCSVGATGTAVVNPGSTGCFGFVIVGHDDVANMEGEYGQDSNGVSRGPFPAACNLTQDLSRRCY